MAGAYYYPTHVEPVLPQTIAPATPNVSMWFVDRLPWYYPKPDSRHAIALTVTTFSEQILPTVPVTRVVAVFQNTPAEMVYALGHTYYQQLAVPILPQPSIAVTVSFAPLQQEYAAVVPRPPSLRNVAAQISAVVNGQFKGLLSVPVMQLGWPVQPMQPNVYPNWIAAILNAVGGTPPPQPQVVPPSTFTLAGFFQEWKPQFRAPWPYAQIGLIQALAEPALPTPFVPIAAPPVSAYFQNLTWQQWTSGRFNWIIRYNDSVSNTLPIPFIPPPALPCTAIPAGFDANSKASSFVDRTGKPIAVLLCRICKSGLPLLVRGDYAIWCQTCCAFVSKQDTYMGTTQAPGFFKDIF